MRDVKEYINLARKHMNEENDDLAVDEVVDIKNAAIEADGGRQDPTGWIYDGFLFDFECGYQKNNMKFIEKLEELSFTSESLYSLMFAIHTATVEGVSTGKEFLPGLLHITIAQKTLTEELNRLLESLTEQARNKENEKAPI